MDEMVERDFVLMFAEGRGTISSTTVLSSFESCAFLLGSCAPTAFRIPSLTTVPAALVPSLLGVGVVPVGGCAAAAVVTAGIIALGFFSRRESGVFSFPRNCGMEPRGRTGGRIVLTSSSKVELLCFDWAGRSRLVGLSAVFKLGLRLEAGTGMLDVRMVVTRSLGGTGDDMILERRWQSEVVVLVEVMAKKSGDFG